MDSSCVKLKKFNPKLIASDTSSTHQLKKSLREPSLCLKDFNLSKIEINSSTLKLEELGNPAIKQILKHNDSQIKKRTLLGQSNTL